MLIIFWFDICICNILESVFIRIRVLRNLSKLLLFGRNFCYSSFCKYLKSYRIWFHKFCLQYRYEINFSCKTKKEQSGGFHSREKMIHLFCFVFQGRKNLWFKFSGEGYKFLYIYKYTCSTRLLVTCRGIWGRLHIIRFYKYAGVFFDVSSISGNETE